jgi:inhibitor of cysteine peptidase
MINKIFGKRIKIKRSVLIGASLILLLLTTVYIFSGCNIKGTAYTEGNNGDNLNLKVNDEITIKLESNITTGFKWNLSNETDANIISLVSSDYKQATADKNLVGAGGFETFTYKAKSKGSTIIILTYNQPWENGVAPLKSFKINIVVE